MRWRLNDWLYASFHIFPYLYTGKLKMTGLLRRAKEIVEARAKGPWGPWFVTTAPQECPDGKMRSLVHGAAPPHGMDNGEDVDAIKDAGKDALFIALMGSVADEMLTVIEAARNLQEGRWLCCSGVNHLSGAHEGCPGCQMVVGLDALDTALAKHLGETK